MGRRRWNKKHPDKAKAQQQQHKRPEDAGDPPVRLLALQPDSNIVAVAIGTRVTIVNCKTGDEVRLLTAPSAVAPAPADEANAGAAASTAADAANAATAPAGPAPPHAGSLRVLAFSPDGRSLLTGGDDKSARLWRAAAADESGGAGYRCVAAWRTPKKMSAGGFSLGGSHALFADKFGDVLVGAAPAAAAPPPAAEPAPQAPGTLLGHFCSIVTGVAPSPCGRFLATSDKEYKVRISVLPTDLLQVACEIQCYCLGHQDFVSCIAFAVRQQHPGQEEQQPESVLLSGSGDGTVRMWDYVSGEQLASYVASAPAAAATAAAAAAGGDGGDGDAAAAAGGDVEKADGAEEGGEEASGGGGDGDDDGEADEDGAGEEGAQAEADGDGGGGGDGGDGSEPQRRSKAPPCAPVLSMAVSEDGTMVAVVVEGDDEIQILDLDWATRRLSLRQRLRWPDVRYPCQAAFGPGGQLWVVGGAPLPSARSVHIGVARRDADGCFAACTEQVLAPAVRALLEARVPEEEAKMAEGGELFVYSRHLRKPAYDEEEVATRKRQRNDHKETQRLAALRRRQDEAAQQKAAQQQGGEVQQAEGAGAEPMAS